MLSTKEVQEFIDRWKPSGGSEMGNFQLFATELTELLDVERPLPVTSDGQNNGYRFERPVTFTHTGKNKRGRIDLYRKGCFVLEAKQGSERPSKDDENQLALLTEQDAPKTQAGHGQRGSAKWDDTMLKARNQADGYARAISKEDGWPPFLMIVDVGHVIELYADFSRQGQGYSQFPDGTRYRITLDDLADTDTRKLLQTIWTDPMSLDPALVTAKVTREIASHLAELGKSFEAQKHGSEKVARFLMRCLFTMFAEDVELIPKGSFTKTLHELRGHPEHAAPTLQALWETMDKGGFSTVLKTDLLRFNGGLFKEADALPLDTVQLSLLIEAAEADWRQVEPAIFGTLLERALDKKQRHKLGAHYTPRAYVERLVVPTIMEPLRSDWKDVQAAALTLAAQGQQDEAIDTVRAFKTKLCTTRVLDPACGSGNFLYVAMEMMKRLEGEVSSLLDELGDKQSSTITVNPEYFLGLELNEWAVAVAELVLWIGYLQWHFRTFGKATPSQPVLKDFKNIKHCDAVLTWTGKPKPRMREDGTPQTRWDGVTTITHQVTGEEVPDPQARIQVFDYTNPKPTKWPEAEFIVGNPPFIGNKRMRESLGDGYVDALWKAYPKVPQSADLVMFWWEKAALMARAYNAKTAKGVRRFGLITTNSLRQTFNRRVLEPHLNDPKKPLSLLFAIPDHPWVDTQFGAAVRISMTVSALGNRSGRLLTLQTETMNKNGADGREVTLNENQGTIFSDLRIGANVASSKKLMANKDLSHQGIIPVGEGFRVGKISAESEFTEAIASGVLRPYLNGKQFLADDVPDYIIDFFDKSEEQCRLDFPILYQQIRDQVKPHRDEVKRKAHRERWWVFAEPRSKMRLVLESLPRFIATCRTAKHRVFGFLNTDILPDAKLIAIGLEQPEFLAVLSSRHHILWSLSTGAFLEDRPNYNHAVCFYTFPFPDLTNTQRTHLAQLGEDLDAHRKRQQAAHPKLTLTQMYNVLEKLRAGDVIEGKDKEIYDQGLIGILRDLHDQIDDAVADAYGWPRDLSDEDILYRLVDLNHERAKEEAAGHVRWLRPDYQNPTGATAAGKTTEMDLGTTPVAPATTPWPKALPDQIAAVREALDELGEASAAQVARQFKGAGEKRVLPLLESLVAIGQADLTDDHKFIV
ncbi:MAG: class I SAM-dependent DNA methyltransferase [Planktomarina sp.]